MTSLYGLFSVFGIFYAVVLIILFLGKGFGQVIWPIILLLCVFSEFELAINPDTDMYVLNETLVPMWLFHPMNLLGSLLIALIVSIPIKIQISQN